MLFFVQPDSAQMCLIRMNAGPALGILFLNAYGQLLNKAALPEDTNPFVNLIHCHAVPATSFVEAKVQAEIMAGTFIMFEPDPDSLNVHGIGAPESLLRVN